MKINPLRILSPILGRGWFIKDDGSVQHPERRLDQNKPFISANLKEHGYRCNWEMDVLFEVVHRMQRVPIRCLSCFKMVLVPTSLRDVLVIEQFQAACEWPAKVGMEIRETVKRAWGAYWYTNSEAEGLERYEFVKSWAEGALQDDWKILLKRGCTEYEQSVGRSDRWEEQPGQREIEDAIHDVVRPPYPPTEPQPENVKANIRENWESWDQLMTPYVTYHDKPKKKEELRRLRQLEARRK